MNPFYVLKAGYDTPLTIISELVEDAEFDECYNAEELHGAQQCLVTPRTRLVEELSWLPELSDMQVSAVLAALKNDDMAPIFGAISSFPELAKANILAHFCDQKNVDLQLVQTVGITWDEIEPEYLLEFVNSSRKKSGFPGVDEPQLREALAEVQKSHSVTIASSIWGSATPGKLMDEFVQSELARNPEASFLERLVRDYDACSEHDLGCIRNEIESYIDTATTHINEVSVHIDGIVNLLAMWDEINQPVQLYEQHHGHEEARSKRIYENVRALCLNLANDHQKYTEAKQLANALLDTFPELESVAEVLKGDVADLESLSEQQQQEQLLDPLINACEAAKKNPHLLKRSIIDHGFRSAKKGPVADIVAAFRDVVQLLTNNTLAYLVIRDLALYFNNDLEDPELAFYLINGLILFPDSSANENFLEKLKEERSTLHRNWKMNELDKSTDNVFVMSKIVDELMEYATKTELPELRRLKVQIDGRKNVKKVKWGFYGAVAIVVVFFLISEELNRPRYKPSYRPTSSTMTQPSKLNSNSNSYAESIPPIGSGVTLNKLQVRYCVFQNKRLNFMRSITSTSNQVIKFNNLIDDYNRRCSNYRYRAGVLASINREADSRESILRSEARRTVSLW